MKYLSIFLVALIAMSSSVYADDDDRYDRSDRAERASERAERASERAERAADQASDRAERAAERAEDIADRVEDRVERMAELAERSERAERRPGRRFRDADFDDDRSDKEVMFRRIRGMFGRRGRDDDDDREVQITTRDIDDDDFEISSFALGSDFDDNDFESDDRFEARDIDFDDDDFDDDDDRFEARDIDFDDDDHDDFDDDNFDKFDDDDFDDDSFEVGQRLVALSTLERDEVGRPVMPREVVFLSSDLESIERVRSLGFSVLQTRSLQAAGRILLRLRIPGTVTTPEALALIRQAEPQATSGYNHIYRPSGPPLSLTKPIKIALVGNLRLGIIDGFDDRDHLKIEISRFAVPSAGSKHGEAVLSVLMNDLSETYQTAPGHILIADVVSEVNGAEGATTDAVVAALDMMTSKKAHIVNMSLTGSDNPLLEHATQKYIESGGILVAAVGNSGPATPVMYPAAYNNVIGVTAVDRGNRPYLLSARGSSVDIAAHGVNIQTEVDAAPVSGTSYATPLVSSFLVARLQLGPIDDIDLLLRRAAIDIGVRGKDPIYGYGVLKPGYTWAQRLTVRLRPH